MAVRKATVESTMNKVEANKASEKAAAAAAEKKAAEKKTPAKKPSEKVVEAKEVVEAPAEKKVAEKKAPAKKAPAKKAVEPKFYVEYAGGQINIADINAKVIEAVGKKTVKELNVYYQPETNKVYYTADGVEGSLSL